MSEISCEEALAEVEHYLHGELDSAAAAELAEHLADCGSCYDRAEFARRLKAVVRSKCQSAAPEYLVVRIQTALRRERGPWA
ncbi:MAG TPA: zf-HC2 domain-containing protein [Actinomycetota bacterium]